MLNGPASSIPRTHGKGEDQYTQKQRRWYLCGGFRAPQELRRHPGDPAGLVAPVAA